MPSLSDADLADQPIITEPETVHFCPIAHDIPHVETDRESNVIMEASQTHSQNQGKKAKISQHDCLFDMKQYQ